jgi:hypothetical protein
MFAYSSYQMLMCPNDIFSMPQNNLIRCAQILQRQREGFLLCRKILNKSIQLLIKFLLQFDGGTGCFTEPLS